MSDKRIKALARGISLNDKRYPRPIWMKFLNKIEQLIYSVKTNFRR